VGGTINHGGNYLLSTNDCIYVAGQTARGGGIQFVCDTSLQFGGPNACGTIQIRNGVSDQVWRYVKMRPNLTDSSNNQEQTIISLNSASVIIFDHVSLAFGDDKNFGVNVLEGQHPINDNITFQSSIIYAALGPDGTGMNFGGQSRSSPDSSSGSSSIIRSYMGGNQWRWPRVAASLHIPGVNNVLFAWTTREGPNFGSEWGEDNGTGCPFPECRRLRAEWLRNYHKPFISNTFERFGAFEWDDGNPGVNGSKQGFPEWYAWRNIHTGLAGEDSLTDQTVWRCNPVRNSLCFNGTSVHTLAEDSAFKSSPTLTPRPFFDADTARWTAREAYDSISSITGLVGASERLECDGTWTYTRDALDSTFVAEVRDSVAVMGAGFAAYGPFGRAIVLDPGTACTDTDGDGMPDDWEDLHTNTNSAVADADGDADNDGWFNIEEYLNKCSAGVSCDPDVFTNNDGSEGGAPAAPTPTYGATRYVYYDTLAEYSDGAITRYMPDTADYGTDGYGVVVKDILSAGKGSPVIIFTDDSVVGQNAAKLDSGPATDTVNVWALPGFTEDSLKNWSVP
jgi:hypothetical protein